MKRKAFIIAILILMTLSSRSYCQTNVIVDSTHVNRISRDLGIDKTLAAKVYEAMHINNSQIEALIKNKNIKSDERQKQFLLLTSEREEKVRALLNPEQQERLAHTMLKYIGKRHFVRKDSLLVLKEQEKKNQ